ncbi:MAG TPA: hypothetical protein VF057_08395, partial [Thermoanaerobaculia bacterium]
MKWIQWIVTAAAAAWACQLAVHHATPIDRALPFMALVAVFLAACTTEALLLVVPALIVAEIAIPDETLRLLAFGLVWSAATSVAALQRRSETGTVCIVLSTLLLLRWIPLENTLIARELLLLVLAIAITLVLGRTPFAAAVAIVTAAAAAWACQLAV